MGTHNSDACLKAQ